MSCGGSIEDGLSTSSRCRVYSLEVAVSILLKRIGKSTQSEDLITTVPVSFCCLRRGIFGWCAFMMLDM